MRDFRDRQPTKTGRRKLTYEDGSYEFVTVEMADEPTVEGTPLNREVYMAMQGFEAVNTTFNQDGSITESNLSGDVLTTVFHADGSITEVFVGTSGITLTKTTTFNKDGSISEVVG